MRVNMCPSFVSFHPLPGSAPHVLGGSLLRLLGLGDPQDKSGGRICRFWYSGSCCAECVV